MTDRYQHIEHHTSDENPCEIRCVDDPGNEHKVPEESEINLVKEVERIRDI
jgi:hypothetical protein